MLKGQIQQTGSQILMMIALPFLWIVLCIIERTIQYPDPDISLSQDPDIIGFQPSHRQ
jgi:hypothetical protein